MERRYITQAVADRMRREAVVLYNPYLRSYRGTVGVTAGVDYYVVSDDDPRLGTVWRVDA